jgi:UPF0176 protein
MVFYSSKKFYGFVVKIYLAKEFHLVCFKIFHLNVYSMQLYNKLSAEERAELIDLAGKQRPRCLYAYAKIENAQFRNELFIAWNKLDALGRIYVQPKE